MAAYTFIGAVESLRFAFDDRAGTGVQPLVAYLYGGGRHRRQNIIGNMGYYTAFGLGIVLMCVSVVGHDVFPPGSICTAMRRFLPHTTGYQFDGVRAGSDPGGRLLYQATGKITILHC